MKKELEKKVLVELIEENNFKDLRRAWVKHFAEPDTLSISFLLDDSSLEKSFKNLLGLKSFFFSNYSHKCDHYPEADWVETTPNQLAFADYIASTAFSRPGIPFTAYEEMIKKAFDILRKELATGTLNLKDSEEVKEFFKYREEFRKELAKTYPVLNDYTGYY